MGVCLTQDAAGDVHGTVYGEAPVEAVRHQVARILNVGRGFVSAVDGGRPGNDPLPRGWLIAQGDHALANAA